MSLFPSRKVVDLIKKSAYWADRSIRSDLALGIIADENDYTSNFTAEFRRQINAKAIKGLFATSYKLNPSVERKTGTDACIILANQKKAKICLFEAKLPRFSKKFNSWDSKQKSTGSSHFSDQLRRQTGYSGFCLIWEMFYCEQSFCNQSPEFFDYLSTCIVHADALMYDKGRQNNSAVWTDFELIDMHKRCKVYQVDDLIGLVCECKIGFLVDLEKVDGLLEDIGVLDVVLVKYIED